MVLCKACGYVERNGAAQQAQAAGSVHSHSLLTAAHACLAWRSASTTHKVDGNGRGAHAPMTHAPQAGRRASPCPPLTTPTLRLPLFPRPARARVRLEVHPTYTQPLTEPALTQEAPPQPCTTACTRARGIRPADTPPDGICVPGPRTPACVLMRPSPPGPARFLPLPPLTRSSPARSRLCWCQARPPPPTAPGLRAAPTGPHALGARAGLRCTAPVQRGGWACA